MPTINNVYVWVEKESVGRSSAIPQHPVEQGLPITDNVRADPKTLSINGKIVDTSVLKASEIVSKLEALENGGSLIKYNGLDYFGNYLIGSFNTDRDKTIHGGYNFDMELTQVRIAKSAYDPSKQKAAEKAKQKNNPTLEVGAIVVFTGGAVYVSSDAKKAAANKGRQTCKITKIETRSWAVHQYHLISTEKKYPYNVYGWVDKANIEGTGSSSELSKGDSGNTIVKTNTSATTNAGQYKVAQKEKFAEKKGNVVQKQVGNSVYTYKDGNLISVTDKKG